MGTRKDIVFGRACVIYCDKREAWALPGGMMTGREELATKVAHKMNDLILAGEKNGRKRR